MGFMPILPLRAKHEEKKKGESVGKAWLIRKFQAYM
jgi:hypothetical protein